MNPLALCAACVALCAPAFAQPIQRPLPDASGHATVREAGRLLRRSLRRIRPDDSRQQARLGLRPSTITSEVRGNIVLMRGDEGEFDINWNDGRQLNEAMYSILRGFYETNPGRNPHFLVINTTFLVRSPQAFYLPTANNVRGIGYEYDHENELFDSGGIGLNGLIFMNSYRTYTSNGPLGQFTFNQEIGHRWGAYVRFEDPITGEPSTDLLGRDCQHWSFFANSDDSAMEGNSWEDLGGGRFRSVSSNMWGFNQLDRYLMGIVPAAAVTPMWFIRDAESWDCAEAFRGGDYNPRWEPPTPLSITGEQVEVEGERVDVPMQSILAVHGERFPDWATSRRTWKAIFLLVAKSNDRVDDRAIEQVDRLRQSWERAFEREATAEGFPAPDLVTTLDGSRMDPPPPEGYPMGERCVRAEDCAEGVNRCIGQASGVRVCTVECAADSPCPEDFCCSPSIPGPDQGEYAWYCLSRGAEGRCEPTPTPYEEPQEPDAALPDASEGDASVTDAGPGIVVEQGGAGGGGCSSAPGQGTPAAWLLIGLAFLRRRQA